MRIPEIHPPIEFETARLRLRQWRDVDREPFAAMNADPRVMEHFPALWPRAQTDAVVDKLTRQIAERGWSFWAVETRAAGEFVGMVGLQVPSAPLPFMPCVEVGWRLAFEHWHRGYATEAARGALEVGFTRLDLPEIVSFTAIGNLRSRAVMERLGMVLEPDTFEHPSVPEGHPVREHCLYRLSRGRWRSP